LTTLGGLLPDLDSDSGIPVREMFNLSGALLPVLLLPRLYGFTSDQILVILAAIYLMVASACRSSSNGSRSRGMFP